MAARMAEAAHEAELEEAEEDAGSSTLASP